jgi:hypothetical protein
MVKKDCETALVARRKERLYAVEEYQSLTYTVKNEELLHRRLGHLHYNALRNIDNIISSEKETDEIPEKTCTVCIQFKAK